ncbi:AAA family ATPase [Vallitalea sp.]|jgi:guanylate kinase|uniref:AAA family ATPase n=1 Tax=Vallitalea sp. TaxID=1882829 RepID=UPI0026007F04|nr:AAA family ATPase [Vallitalea sp.]MCT4686962.1 ATP-binding protein [Vallitalea sp.]
MGTIYIFRGKAATGKSTLANMIGKNLSIPVFCKDDIVDALKSSTNIDKRFIRNEICYNILLRMIQRSLDLNTDIILDIALGDRRHAKAFFDRLDFKDNKIMKFFLNCSDVDEWKRRHEERLKNPLPHQSFRSIDHVFEHYKKLDVNPFDDEYIIDTSKSVEDSLQQIDNIINTYT